jgi:DNA ligase (NAD+)
MTITQKEEIEKLIKQLERYNRAYRLGEPLVSDREYDRLTEELRALDPQNPFLLTVEREKFEDKIEVRHPAPMLSIEKAYDNDQLERFIVRVEKAAADIGVDTVLFKATVKLDGLAGRDDGRVFATRGNGRVGYEISSAFDKGVIPIGGRGHGLGEIVIVQSYFNTNLSDAFEHPRNMVVGIISSDVLNERAKKALDDKMVHFVPYTTLPNWTGTASELLDKKDQIVARLTDEIDYPVDGVVVGVTNDEVKEHMGATAHHYRWQIAIKSRGETTVTLVEDITWQVGRTGNVTPVMMVQPVVLSGATIRRVTAHHAGLIKKKQIGPGAEIQVIRSGEVIPKLEKVCQVAEQADIPDRCPSCGTLLKWNNDFLKCDNPDCKAQIEQRISHWFKTLGSADWFGIKSIQKLVDGGYDKLEKIYDMDEEHFVKLGFGPVQSKNLADALSTSISKPVEDWRFLAAFGIPNLGTGDSRNILTHFRLEDLLNANADQIKEIHGFGDITSQAVTEGLKTLRNTITGMLALGFNLERTPLAEYADQAESPVSGKSIVFTGKMKHGSREEMQQEARRLGAKVQTSVSGRTDILVCGENVGRAKIEKAENAGTRIISEENYYAMIEAFVES